jgi:hypothetical protein
VAVTLGGCVGGGDDLDPAGITSLANTTVNPEGGPACTPNCSADAIMPFTLSRWNMWSGLAGGGGPPPGVGYFHDPTVAYPGGAALNPGIKLLTGTPTDGHPVYNSTYNLSIVYRWIDQVSPTPWLPGGSLNWAKTLFCNPGGVTTPFFQTAAGKTLIEEAGADPTTQSCLNAPFT